MRGSKRRVEKKDIKKKKHRLTKKMSIRIASNPSRYRLMGRLLGRYLIRDRYVSIEWNVRKPRIYIEITVKEWRITRGSRPSVVGFVLVALLLGCLGVGGEVSNKMGWREPRHPPTFCCNKNPSYIVGERRVGPNTKREKECVCQKGKTGWRYSGSCRAQCELPTSPADSTGRIGETVSRKERECVCVQSPSIESRERVSCFCFRKERERERELARRSRSK